jgi:hypothetical protein
MQDVIGALHGLQVLEARHAEPETIAAVEAQLTQLSAVLFEQLEIEYSEQDIKDFVTVLRSPKFALEITIEQRVGIKDLGTHESKYFARMASAVVDAEGYIQQALGTWALSALGLRIGKGKAA